MRIVVALGGNALLNPARKNTFADYSRRVSETCKALALLAEKHEIIVTHGNGPQVGDIMFQQEKARTLSLPLDVDVAETQGQIGYLLQQGLANEMDGSVVCVLTRVIVGRDDKAFRRPSKPVGPFYNPRQAYELKGRFSMAKIGSMYRRVVASPEPKAIVEIGAIKELAKSNVVIACGGGGIPVAIEKGRLVGVEAVIDKDMTACLLAKSVSAQMLIMLTDVDGVYLAYGKSGQRLLKRMKAGEAERLLGKGEFREGSMAPKVRAAARFAKSGGLAVIAHLSSMEKAVHGKAGTVITK